MSRVKWAVKDIVNHLNFQQNKYIKCKKGCSICCKSGEFPYSQIEFNYLTQGFLSLEPEKRKQIQTKIKKLIEQKKEYKGKIFEHDCPFLIEEECSVYEYRGIVCRTFGLVNQNPKDEDSKLKVPFCYKFGLNYSNVMDEKQNKITQEKIAKAHTKEEPHGFNIDYHFLTGDDFERGFNFSFGEKKALIDWFYDFGWGEKL